MIRYPHFFQKGKNDCGLACIKCICALYAIPISNDLKRYKYLKLSLFDISKVLMKLNIKSLAIQITNIESIHKIDYPFLAIWNDKHYIIVYKANRRNVYISDPKNGLVVVSRETFKNFLFNNKEGIGKILLFKKDNII